VTYGVTFIESGLPSSAKWCALLGGGKPHCTTKTAQSFPEPNGTYSYTLSTTQRGYSASGGSFTVDGLPVSLPVTFARTGGGSPAVLMALQRSGQLARGGFPPGGRTANDGMLTAEWGLIGLISVAFLGSARSRNVGDPRR